MSSTKLLVAAACLTWAASLYGSPTGVSVAINFGADEPNALGEAFVDGPAGVVGTANWNNTEGATDIFDDIALDVGGDATASGIQVEWISNNTWSTDGRGEDNNDAPDGNDRNLMLGYLDTTDVSVTEVIVSGLPPEIAGGYDVFLYTLGGVLGRGGTYTVRHAGGDMTQENLQTVKFDGTYIEGAEGNYLFFEGLTGDELTIEAMATAGLVRGPLNGIEICASGHCIPRPTPVAGRGVIGDQVVAGSQENVVLGPPQDPKSGLSQEWYSVANPGSKDGVDQIFESNDPIVPAFQAGHGATWWTGNGGAFGDLVQYPDEVQPPFNATNNDNYVVRATGELLIPESGTYRFADAVDDYTYLAIDLDKSGVAGDNVDEVLIDDNSWTSVYRADNGGGGGWAEVDIDVAQGGEWLAMEFNMGEGGGGDSGIVYWDYDPNAPEGQRLGGAAGFPEFTEDPIDPVDAETMYIPDSHLRSVVRELISADLVGRPTAGALGLEFEIDGDSDTADRLIMNNPDPAVFTTVLDVEGLEFHLVTSGALQPGDSFQILDANQISGSPLIIPGDPGQTWIFNPATGRVTFGAALPGDYNRDGAVDVADIDLQSVAMKTPDQDLATFDENGDGVINTDDRTIWVQQHAKTWYGDANFDGEFNTDDLVQVFAAGKYEVDTMAGWGEGDWDGDMRFSSGDLVAAFSDGGYELGPRMATAAVPEPSTILLVALGLLGLCRVRRSR